MIHRSLLAITLLTAALSGSSQTASSQAQAPTLKETFKDDFLIGMAINTRQIEEKDPAAARLILQQFNAVTPENIMKAEIIHPGWDQYNFDLADKLVAYAQKNNLKVNAHNLIWHSQLPGYVHRIKDADSLRTWFTNHITTIASRSNRTSCTNKRPICSDTAANSSSIDSATRCDSF